MGNMAYCRFQNTLMDLMDCENHLYDDDLSIEETQARVALIRLCRTIAEDGQDILAEEVE
jgi:hypothetical protein